MYKVYFNFKTNGEYNFKYIPCDMIYDGDSNYKLEKIFEQKDSATQYAILTADFLYSHIDCCNDFLKEKIQKKIKTFEEEIIATRKEKNPTPYIAHQCIPGDFEESELSIYEIINNCNINISMNDEEFKIYKNHKDDFINSINKFVKNKLKEYESEKNNE